MAKAEWYEGKEGKAEHLVYLNKEGKEIDKLLVKEKTMIIRGAAGRKSPLCGRAKVDDFAYFVQTGGDLTVTHKGIISKVIESEKMTKEELDSIILCIGKISEYDYTSKGATHVQAEAMFSLYNVLKKAAREQK